MRLNLKSLTAGIIIGTMGVTTVFAAQTLKLAEYNSNKVVFDGKELDLTETPMVSVIKEGETNAANYMPLRGVLEAMGYEVYWDSATKTVIISSGDYSGEDMARMLTGYWIYEDEYIQIKCNFTGNGGYTWETTDKQSTPPKNDFEKGTFIIQQDSYLSMKGRSENSEAREHSIEIAFGADGERWSYGPSNNLRIFERYNGDTDRTDGGNTVSMQNPWNTSTEDEAFKYLGANFKIEPPVGYKLSEAAVLAKPYADENGNAARFAYINGDNDMYRVHIYKGAAKELINQGEPVKANGIDAYYNSEVNSVAYGQGDYMIIIDMSVKEKDVLLKTAGSVTLSK